MSANGRHLFSSREDMPFGWGYASDIGLILILFYVKSLCFNHIDTNISSW